MTTTPHTVARSTGATTWDITTRRTRTGAAGAFYEAAYAAVRAEALLDRPYGRDFCKRAMRVALAIESGAVVAADLAFCGQTVTFTAGR